MRVQGLDLSFNVRSPVTDSVRHVKLVFLEGDTVAVVMAKCFRGRFNFNPLVPLELQGNCLVIRVNVTIVQGG